MTGWFNYYEHTSGHWYHGPFSTKEAAERGAKENPEDYVRTFYGKLFEVVK